MDALRPSVLIWWTKLGKYQVVVTIVTLAVYFSTAYFTGDKVLAAFAAPTAALIVALGALVVAMITFAPPLAASAAALVVTLAAPTALLATSAAPAATLVIALVTPIALVTLVAAIVVSADAKEQRGTISHKTIIFTYGMQFVFIFTPIWISMIG
ncbi:MAG: hypothetical protein ACKKL5_04145 [Candidatus Komeilibacteria bacterium]